MDALRQQELSRDFDELTDRLDEVCAAANIAKSHGDEATVNALVKRGLELIELIEKHEYWEIQAPESRDLWHAVTGRLPGSAPALKEEEWPDVIGEVDVTSTMGK